jgi:hypothetical protein
MTSTFWRNAWRYRERAYRHTFWDAGTSLSHILAVAASARVAATLVLGFADAAVNALLDVGGTRESAVALVALGHTEAAAPPAPEVGRLDLPTRPLSSAEVTWHALTDMHLASCLPTGADAGRWRSRRWERTPPPPAGPLTALAPLPADRLDARPPEQIIFRRRSTRKYDTDVEIPFAAFSTLLDRSTRGVASDVLTPGRRSPTSTWSSTASRGWRRGSTCTIRDSARSSCCAKAVSARRPPASRPTNATRARRT